MYFKQEMITPTVAAEMLTKNHGNRHLNNRRVTMLANDMRAGRWTESPQPIAFDAEGNLIDGQHRLEAVQRSGVPVLLSVAYDVPRESVIDRTLERRLGDALYMRGIISQEMAQSAVISTVNSYFSCIDGRDYFTISDAEKAEFINAHTEDIQKTIDVTGRSTTYTYSKRASVRAAILGAIIQGVDPAKLKDFCEVLNTGFMQNLGQSAAVVLRNYIMTHPAAGRASNTAATLVTEMAIHDFISEVPRKNKYTRKSHIYVKM